MEGEIGGGGSWLEELKLRLSHQLWQQGQEESVLKDNLSSSSFIKGENSYYFLTLLKTKFLFSKYTEGGGDVIVQIVDLAQYLLVDCRK